MLPSVYDALRAACWMRVQWQSPALPIILLTAAIDFAAASSADAQTPIPPVPAPPLNLSPGSITNVVGGTLNTTGDIFRAPTSGAAATLNINSGLATAGPITITTGSSSPVTDSGLVINAGGLGQPGNNNHTSTAINVTVQDAPGDPIILTSSGHAVFWGWGSGATLTALGTTPSELTFVGNGIPVNFSTVGATAQEATVVTVQNGATATLTNVTLDVGGPAGFLPGSKMALCAGACGESGDPGSNIGGNATLNNVVIDVTSDNSAGIWVSRLGTTKVTGGSITTAGANSTGVHADLSGAPILTDVPITVIGNNSVGVSAGTFVVADVANRLTDSTGTITINGGMITTTGDNSTAVKASGSYASVGGSTATVTLDGTNIETMGAGSTGLAVCACNGVSLNNGDDSRFFGPAPPQVGGTIIATNTNIMMTGPNSIGVFAQDGSAPQGTPNGMGGQASPAVRPAVPPARSR